MTPIPLDANYLTNLAANPAVRRAFPDVQQAAVQLKAARGKCTGCGASSKPVDAAVDRLRQLVLSMPPEKLSLLKATLGLAADRTFVAYSGGRRVTR